MKHELIIKIGNIEFFKGNVIKNYAGGDDIVLIYTNDENFRIPATCDLIKECSRIYNNYYC